MTYHGVPGITDAGRLWSVGAINILYGTANGATTATITISHKNSRGIGGKSAVGDQFGASVASGDIDNDGFDDVIMAYPVITDAGVESVVL
ncbi:MAG: hypothetical protein Ct9H90mP30_5580 [Actinomycetota bacterium]|nr:MAG: hypothetical protein Ct9H90mP30_5580 [Actinomycetota bacterium]